MISIVQFGQGLIEQAGAEDFKAAIEAVSPGTKVTRSMSTYASEEAGLGANDPGCNQQ